MDGATATRAGGASTMTIKTPDQRLRVFISSTLGELAEERAAARRAVDNLHLSPILFELGARPHPPSELYRAYLEQSHIFVGIYWDSYGWVAPGEEISGIEDEYILAADRPKLIYIKRSAGTRDERLEALLQRIAREGVSYKRFSDAAELERLIADDLALLLTERFETAVAAGAPDAPPGNIPALLNAFVGRDEELAELVSSIRAGLRLVTITGPGGVGKSRLALEAATALLPHFEDGSFLVMLHALTDPALVASTIAHALDVDETGPSAEAALRAYLRDRHVLLVLDNFEQIVAAGPLVSSILADCSRATMLVTSREPLNVRGEQEFPLLPLEVPDPHAEDLRALAASPGVKLFVERARAATPRFVAQGDGLRRVAEIVHRVDGLPLAIELAAARTRVMSAEAMLDRLHDRFRLLSGGWRDLPERHRTLKRTIDWSFELLTGEEKRLFARLAVFHGGATLDAIEAVCGADMEDPVSSIGSLVEKSLVLRSFGEAEPRYSMLETIREYALDRLRLSGEEQQMCAAHCDHYLEMARRAGQGLRGPAQPDWLHALDGEVGNIRGAITNLLSGGRAGDAAEMAWLLWQFWWLHDHIEEGRRWVAEILEHDLEPHQRAMTKGAEAILAFWMNDFGIAVPAAIEATELFRSVGDEPGAALTELPIAFAEAVLGEAEGAVQRFSRSCTIFDEAQDPWGSALARIGLCWLWVGQRVAIPEDTFDNQIRCARTAGTPVEQGMALGNLSAWYLEKGDLAAARDAIAESLELLFGARIRFAVTYGLDIVGELALRTGEPERAARTFALADAVREKVGAPLAPMHQERRACLVEDARRGVGDEPRYAALVAQGRHGYPDGIREAIAWTRSLQT